MCLHERNKHLLRESVNRLAELGCRGLKVNPVGDVGEWKANGFGRGMTTAALAVSLFGEQAFRRLYMSR